MLKKAGLTMDQISKQVGVSRRTVALIAREPSVEERPEINCPAPRTGMDEDAAPEFSIHGWAGFPAGSW